MSSKGEKRTFRLSDNLTLSIALWKDNIYYHLNNSPKSKSVTLNKDEFDKLISNCHRLIDISKSMLDSLPKKTNVDEIKKRKEEYLKNTEDSTDKNTEGKIKKSHKKRKIESFSSSDSDSC